MRCRIGSGVVGGCPPRHRFRASDIAATFENVGSGQAGVSHTPPKVAAPLAACCCLPSRAQLVCNVCNEPLAARATAGVPHAYSWRTCAPHAPTPGNKYLQKKTARPAGLASLPTTWPPAAARAGAAAGRKLCTGHSRRQKPSRAPWRDGSLGASRTRGCPLVNLSERPTYGSVWVSALL